MIPSFSSCFRTSAGQSDDVTSGRRRPREGELEDGLERCEDCSFVPLRFRAVAEQPTI